MTFTGYLKTEQPPSKLFSKGHTWVVTSINNTSTISEINYFPFNIRYRRNIIASDENYYCHTASPTEPNTDGSLTQTDFTGQSPTEYSSLAPGYIKSFTSETGIFTSAQDFSTHNTTWDITYLAKYSGTPPTGTTVYIRFEFYKRDSSNNDTLLCQTGEIDLGLIYSERSASVAPNGSVATSDRLRIRVYVGARTPTK